MDIPTNISSISFKVGFDQRTNDDFQFQKPPEAPVFRPSPEEFAKGPLEYIKSIRPLAEPYGICRIIPPDNFKPAFEVDQDKFAFKPRVQRINELEALTRAKLCFFEKVIKYWNLQGVSLKIPLIERKIVDLYQLHRSVFEEGGFEQCVREKKWMKIANKLYPTNSNKSLVGSLLRQHYERILYPYDIFASGAATGFQCVDESTSYDNNNNSMNLDTKTNGIKNEPVDQLANSSADQHSLNSNNNNNDQECDEKCLTNSKTGRTVSRRSSARLSNMNSPVTSSSSYTKMMNLNDAINNQRDVRTPDRSSSKVFCKLCNITREQDRSRRLLECDTCKDNFHLNCLIVPLNNVPRGKWNCPKCVSELVPKLPKLYTREFGFAESRCKYTLNEFEDAADNFKRDYFGMEPDEIDPDLIEKEFWRLLTNIDDQVTVEYGADLHTNLVGSGFASTRNARNADLTYLNHPWNLNKLPLIEGSLFKYVNSNISGMIIPWIYVGMCFSTFCWHTEDHWTGSINYNHHGSIKTWYGIPGNKAPEFEEAMSTIAPSLFEASPDLLHQLVTICNPNILQSKGVPIYRTNQHAGEFVVTFSRSYHSGFNQGFNIAEAVNFAPSDWLSLGRECMTSYSEMKRYPVFSHDELICNMSTAENLNPSLFNLVYDDLLGMVQNERNLRREALEYGITKSLNVYFNTLPDDERQCDYCKTTCYLSALTCECDGNKLVCLKHMKELCKRCSSDQFILKYTFKLDDLVNLLKNLRERITRYEKFNIRLKRTIDSLDGSFSSATSSSSEMSSDESKVELKELVELRDKSKQLSISENSSTMMKLNENLKIAAQLQKRLNNLLDQPNRTLFTFDEFKQFVRSVNDCNVILDRKDELNDLNENAIKMVNEIKQISQEKKIDRKLLEKLTTSNKLKFLNLYEFLSEDDDIVNRSPAKRIRLNRLSNSMISPSIKNSAF